MTKIKGATYKKTEVEKEGKEWKDEYANIIKTIPEIKPPEKIVVE